MNVAADLSDYVYLPKKEHGKRVHQPLLVAKERLSLIDAEQSLRSIFPYANILGKTQKMYGLVSIKIGRETMPLEEGIELNLYDVLTKRAENYGARTQDIDLNGYLGYLTWMESHKVLQNLSTRHIMLNPRRFVDFLDLLVSGEVYDGNGDKIPEEGISAILEQIIGETDCPKSEYLDMYFVNQMGYMVANYNHVVLENGLIPGKAELLKNCSIISSVSRDLYHLINNSNEQGLPNKEFAGKPRINLYYNPPKNNHVAAFRSVSFTTILDCDVSLNYQAPIQGVRPVLSCN